jgi:hypothetical protein
MAFENIMLGEVSQVQKDKGHMLSLMWKIGPNINASIIIYTYICTQNMFPIVGLSRGD